MQRKNTAVAARCSDRSWKSSYRAVLHLHIVNTRGGNAGAPPEANSQTDELHMLGPGSKANDGRVIDRQRHRLRTDSLALRWHEVQLSSLLVNEIPAPHNK